MLYSAANGSWDPWAKRQMIRLGIGLVAMLVLALIDIRIWMKYAYFMYFASLMLLLAVEYQGLMGGGAQRWLNLKFFLLQPSEVMKISLVLALARYFHSSTINDVERIPYLIVPIIMVLIPAGLIIRQPDLGTALLLIMIAGIMLFVVGVQMWKFGVIFASGLIAIPIVYKFFLHDYQRNRVKTFINPDNDPMGAGYHIIQSKIAMGSGGVFGKGFMQGTQSRLDFLPEKQTDFIFTMLGEEFGMIGGLILIGLYMILVAYGIIISVRSQNYFGRLVAIGVTVNFFLYMFINMAMVMGLIPVVGVPLPLISYGGTALLTLMVGFGLIQCVNIHKDVIIGRRGASEEY